MIPVYQTRFGSEGNCHAACVASIFEVPIDQVPWPTREELASEEGWLSYHVRLDREFLMPRGFYEVWSSAVTGDGSPYIPSGFAVLAIASPGAVGAHAVVCLDGEIVFDPNPGYSIEDHENAERLMWSLFGVLDPTTGKKERL